MAAAVTATFLGLLTILALTMLLLEAMTARGDRGLRVKATCVKSRSPEPSEPKPPPTVPSVAIHNGRMARPQASQG